MNRRYKFITYADRQKIEWMWLDGAGTKDIAREIGVSVPAIYAELPKGQNGKIDKNQRLAYVADLAEQNIQESMRRRGNRRSAGSR